MDTFQDTTLFRTVRVRSGVAPPPTHTHTTSCLHMQTQWFKLDRELPQGFAAFVTSSTKSCTKFVQLAERCEVVEN